MKTIPITRKVKERKVGKFPKTYEVALKADGSGGPVAVGKSLEKVVKQLKGASQMHAKQAKMVQNHINEMKNMKTPAKEYVSDAQRKAVHASKADGGKGNPNSPSKGKKERMARRAVRKQERDHNRAARRTEGTRLGQMLRRTFGSGKVQKPETPAKRKDACYHKVKARYDVFPSAYASGAIASCRKVGAANWGNKSKKKK